MNVLATHVWQPTAKMNLRYKNGDKIQDKNRHEITQACFYGKNMQKQSHKTDANFSDCLSPSCCKIEFLARNPNSLRAFDHLKRMNKSVWHLDSKPEAT